MEGFLPSLNQLFPRFFTVQEKGVDGMTTEKTVFYKAPLDLCRTCRQLNVSLLLTKRKWSRLADCKEHTLDRWKNMGYTAEEIDKRAADMG